MPFEGALRPGVDTKKLLEDIYNGLKHCITLDKVQLDRDLDLRARQNENHHNF